MQNDRYSPRSEISNNQMQNPISFLKFSSIFSTTRLNKGEQRKLKEPSLAARKRKRSRNYKWVLRWRTRIQNPSQILNKASKFRVFLPGKKRKPNKPWGPFRLSESLVTVNKPWKLGFQFLLLLLLTLSLSPLPLCNFSLHFLSVFFFSDTIYII